MSSPWRLAGGRPPLGDAGSIDGRGLVLPALLVALAAAVALVVVRMAVSAQLSSWAAAILVPLAAVVATVSLACFADRVNDRRSSLPAILVGPRRLEWWRAHPGTALACFALVLGLPLLGAYSLVDPWESHYGEVAREMIERGDYVSPWWGHDGWFRSKPVLLFWTEAVSMKLFAVGTGPDQVLAAAAGLSRPAHPEWALRLPGFLGVVLGAVALQRGITHGLARASGGAGTWAALVFLTMSGTVLLAHQAITDTPLLGATAAALGLLAAAARPCDQAGTRQLTLRFGGRRLTIHGGHLVGALLLLLVVPQLVPLLHLHDHVRAGSPHACTLPGQPACADSPLAHPSIAPLLQVALWAPLLALLVTSFAEETRSERLLMAGAWIAAAIGTMAKGPVGLVVPAAGALLALVSGRPRRPLGPLLRLEIVRGLGIVVVLVLPWYLAMYARHGRPFVDELVMRNMLGRTLEHLHDTNSSEDTGIAYFVKQLGYGTFPWSGLAAVAMLTAAARSERVDGRGGSARDRVRTLFFGSALATFVLVSTMGTKFHHYVLVALPGIAGVTGMFVDERILRAAGSTASRRTWVALVVLATAITWLVGRDFTLPLSGDALAPSGAARFFHLLTYRYDRRWVSTACFVPALAVAAPLFALAVLALVRRHARPRRRVAFALAGLAAAFSAWLGNVYPMTGAHDGGQREVLSIYEAARLPGGGPLVAYELNWMGENFYTGNDVAIFLSGGAAFKAYIDGERAHGRPVYIVTERPRLRALRAELGSVKRFTELATSDVCDEFVLVRVDT